MSYVAEFRFDFGICRAGRTFRDLQLRAFDDPRKVILQQEVYDRQRVCSATTIPLRNGGDLGQAPAQIALDSEPDDDKNFLYPGLIII
ncbi:MAG: hypothetical protein NVS2B5_11880 [Beijerinckiaceae bacterium]